MALVHGSLRCATTTVRFQLESFLSEQQHWLAATITPWIQNEWCQSQNDDFGAELSEDELMLVDIPSSPWLQ